MPNQPKTPARAARLDDELWRELNQRAYELGSDRSSVIRELVRWWLRRPGAKMPARPAGDSLPPSPPGWYGVGTNTTHNTGP